MVLIPALLMVSTIRFRSFKTIDLQTRRPFRVLLLIAAGIMLIVWMHRYVLVVMAYSYLASAFIGMAVTRFRHRSGRVPPSALPTETELPAISAAGEAGQAGQAVGRFTTWHDDQANRRSINPPYLA